MPPILPLTPMQMAGRLNELEKRIDALEDFVNSVKPKPSKPSEPGTAKEAATPEPTPEPAKPVKPKSTKPESAKPATKSK